jgi:SAM-dependent methyltransferase
MREKCSAALVQTSRIVKQLNGLKMAIYNEIGKFYDATRRADSFIVSRLAEHLKIRATGDYLDAACGTGNYTTALAESFGGNWRGVDQSLQMIDAARMKTKRVNWHQANVESLPFQNKTFDGAICTLAIHHFESLDAAFGETRRVLKDDSRFIIFTSTPEQTANYWLAEYFPEAIRKSAECLPDLKTIADALRKNGFSNIETEPYSVAEDLQDLFLYSGKFKPEMYLDANFRANISTFSLLAEPSEIESGCERLRNDIASGKINEFIERHKQSDDYLLVTART